VIEASEESGTTPERKEKPVEQAVSEYLADAKARELSEATLYKLDIFFRKQFLPWCKSEEYRLLRELDFLAVRSFRSSWKDGAMARKKKQERVTGFFWFCISRELDRNESNAQPRTDLRHTGADRLLHTRRVRQTA
jgi:hypothetical protein